MIASILFRFLLLLISFKWPKVCKLYLFFDMTFLSIEQGLVKNVDYETMNQIVLLSQYSVYFTLSYDLVPSFIVTFISQVGFQAIQIVLYMQSVESAVASLIGNLLVLLFGLCAV